MKAGGRRPGAGRKKGSTGKHAVTRELRGTIEEMARRHTDVALNSLAQIAAKSESDAARVAASQALLDRGYGKSRQAVDATVSGEFKVFIGIADSGLL